MADLTGKVAIVTGAASGIGEAAARRLAADGASVILGDVDADGLARVAGDIGAAAVTQVADVSSQADCEALVKLAQDRFGRLDVLVNNAGVDHLGPFDDGPIDQFKHVIETDLYGLVYLTRAALPLLRATKGNVVNVSSVSGLGGDWNHSFYCAAKGAVTNLTRALAMDEAANGVRVNAVNPSFTLTALTAGMQEQPDLVAEFEQRIPMGRGAEAHEVASVISFLAGDDAVFVTGVNLPVDGGLSAANGQPRLR